MINQRIQSNHKNEIGEIIPHIVQTACAFHSSIIFEVAEKRVNAKSIRSGTTMIETKLLNRKGVRNRYQCKCT